MMLTLLTPESPFALKSVAKGGSSASVRGQRHLVNAGRAAGRNALDWRDSGYAVREGGRREDVEHFERAVAVAAIDPNAVRGNTVRSRFGVVHGPGHWIQDDTHKTAQSKRERVAHGVDDLDPRVRAIAEIVLVQKGIDPADVERPERVARYLNRGQALGLRCRGRPGTSARSGDCRIARYKRHCQQNRWRDNRACYPTAISCHARSSH